MGGYKNDPSSSDRVNSIMRQAYCYLEDTPMLGAVDGKAKASAKPPKRRQLRVGKNKGIPLAEREVPGDDLG